MKKRNRRRKLGKQRPSNMNAKRLRLEDLEPKRLLAGDVVLGPANLNDVDRVRPTLIHTERESGDVAAVDRLSNNTVGTAESLSLGFGPDEYTGIDVRGELIEPNSVGSLLNKEVGDPAATPPIPPAEDSSIILANRVNHQTGNPIQIDAVLGDSLEAGLADGDYYELESVETGQTITAHLDIPLNGNTGLISGVLVLYNQFGQVLQTTDALENDRGFGDTYLNWVTLEPGDYYIAVVPYSDAVNFEVPSNPFNPTRVGQAALTEQTNYTLTIGVDAVDVDYYAVDLNQGDILGLSTIGAGNVISMYSPEQEFIFRSGNNHDDTYPTNSPLPSGGVADLAFVADRSGTYYFSIEGYNWANYLLQTRLFRPAIESAPQGTRQILYLDFDGAELVPDSLLPGAGESVQTLSPLRLYLPGWGLRRGDENALIDRIVQIVEEDLNGDLQRYNPDAGVIIKNSRDHGDIFGQPYVSRVIVGGSQAQSLIPTIGIANSVDYGNFDLEEDSIVLLDTLSSPGQGQNVSGASINSYPLAPGASRIDLVAAGIAGVISHEAGHYFGAWHTEPANDVFNIMDAGGLQGLDDLIGAGQDGIFGNADDEPVRFVQDQFAHDEGSYYGLNNVPANLANVLISGKGVGDVEGITGMTVSGTVFHDENENGFADPGEGGVEGVEVFIDLNHDGQFSIGEPASLTDASGDYTIDNIPGVVGSLDILIVTQDGQFVTTPPAGGYSIAVGSAIPVNASFGLAGNVGSSGLDYSDAPESYGVASHPVQDEISLGETVTVEDAPVADDAGDDGVTISGVVTGAVANVMVTANTGSFVPGVVNAWMDFNQDGTFSDSEQIITDLRLSGSATVEFAVPEDAVLGTTWSRFRYGYVRGVGATGASGVGEVEDHAVLVTDSDGGDGGNGGNLAAPIANDDTFVVTTDSSTVLPVLNNDSNGFDANLIIDSVNSISSGGSVQIDAEGQTVTYTPAAGFTGTETFIYTIANSVGVSSAVVSVSVEEPGPVDNGEPLVGFRLDVTDSEGTPITNIAPGEDFVLVAYTDDLRAGGTGVYAAYLDVEFDGNLATANGPVTFGDDYPAGQSPAGGAVGDVTNELDEYGAFGGFIDELGPDERVLFSVPMTATQDGTLTFSSNAAENLPRHEVLLFDILQAIPEERIEYGSVTLTVGTPQVAAFTNPVNARDVNNDGVVSPRDALIVINAINNDGAGPLDRDAAAVSNGFFVDVNGDRNLSAIDVLLIINALNEPASEAPAAEPPAAPAVDAAFASDDDEEDEDGLFSL